MYLLNLSVTKVATTGECGRMVTMNGERFAIEKESSRLQQTIYTVL